MTIVWLIPNLVPYHHAKFEAFAAAFDGEAHIVQVTSRDAFKILEYNPETVSYELHTLFEKDAHAVGRPEMRDAVQKTLVRLKPDCICVSGWGLAIGQAALLAAFRLKLPVVLCSDSNEFDEPRVWHKELLKKQFVGKCSGFFVAGTSAKDYIVRLGGKTCVMGYDVVDNQHFARAGERPPELPKKLEGAPWFFACARFEEKKNYPGLLRAYAAYLAECKKREGIVFSRLVIAGDGMLQPQIEKEITGLGLDDHVCLLGAVGYHSLPWLYQNCSAFVHASTTEQWGLVVNEAMAAGAPLLLSCRCGCAADLLKEAENGFGFDPTSEKGITKAMLRFSTLGAAQQRAFGEKSRAIIHEWDSGRFADGMTRAVTQAMTVPSRNTRMARVLLGLLLGRN